MLVYVHKYFIIFLLLVYLSTTPSLSSWVIHIKIKFFEWIGNERETERDRVKNITGYLCIIMFVILFYTYTIKDDWNVKTIIDLYEANMKKIFESFLTYTPFRVSLFFWREYVSYPVSPFSFLFFFILFFLEISWYIKINILF